MCDQDPSTPFCTPQDGASFQIGTAIQVTWSPDFFTLSNPPGPAPPQIFLQVDFPLTTPGAPSTIGFTSPALDLTAGSFTWPILDTYLPIPSSTATTNTTTTITATLSLAVPLSQNPANGTFVRIGSGTMRFPGPSVILFREGESPPSGESSSMAGDMAGNMDGTNPFATPQRPQQQMNTAPGMVNPLAVALPTTLAVLTAIGMVVYYIVVRRRRQGYGVRLWPFGAKNKTNNARGQTGEVGTFGIGNMGNNGKLGKGSAGVRLGGKRVEIRVVQTDVEGLRGNAERWFAGGGVGEEGGGEGNVFREEVRRQERERF
ncbi:uncharacterized protein C8A04DRAFT_26169 [Dichotomopilus funicola]|uniref:Uncharacterized protein n=1 Tax=Dichotomopilus funicola TaxID=1934379 RepID=A0AAN6V734_9PEZI|nr:hypothetical protein C8A04DRAFT_26169 [Dichotomopilus funicola]